MEHTSRPPRLVHLSVVLAKETLRRMDPRQAVAATLRKLVDRIAIAIADGDLDLASRRAKVLVMALNPLTTGPYVNPLAGLVATTRAAAAWTP